MVEYCRDELWRQRRQSSSKASGVVLIRLRVVLELHDSGR